MRRAQLVAIAVGVGLIGATSRAAWARRGVRPLFEPTDLELEETGVVEVDVQAGAIRGQGPWRLVVPDFEIDVGVTHNVEIDVDGAYAIEAEAPGSTSFRNSAPDNLWVGAKVGVVDWADDDGVPDDLDAWSIGMQAGPKLPIAPGSSGLGLEVLALIGHLLGRTHFVLNFGAFTDPHPAPDMGRPIGVEAGLDVSRDLDPGGKFQVTAELAGVRFISPDPHQLLATAGFAWSPTPDTQLALIGMWGFLDGNDKYGALLGMSQKLRPFGRK
jgi:hypothetical protein